MQFTEVIDLEDVLNRAPLGGQTLPVLSVMKDGKKIGYEFKYTDKVKITPSMRIAVHDLGLDHLFVIYPGSVDFPLDTKITARGLS